MKRVAHTLLLLVLIAVMAAPGLAADKKKKKKKEAKGPSAVKMAQQFLKDIELTDKQKQEIEEVGKQYIANLTEARKKMVEALPEDYKKARAEAMKAAKEAGKKGKELREAVEAAAPLPEGAKEAMKEAHESLKKAQMEFREAVVALLTDEQKAKLPKAKPAKTKKKKKDAA